MTPGDHWHLFQASNTGQLAPNPDEGRYSYRYLLWQLVEEPEKQRSPRDAPPPPPPPPAAQHTTHA